MTRSKDEFELVRALVARRHNTSEIAWITGIPRSTVRDWRRGSYGQTERSRGSRRCDLSPGRRVTTGCLHRAEAMSHMRVC